MSKSKKPRKKRQPFNRWRTTPRLAYATDRSQPGSRVRFLAVECFDPRCGCAPGEWTYAPVPVL